MDVEAQLIEEDGWLPRGDAHAIRKTSALSVGLTLAPTQAKVQYL